VRIETPMPEIAAVESKRGVVVLLMLILGGVIGLLVMIPSESQSNRFFGACLIAAGAMNVLLRRMIGRQLFRQVNSSSPLISNFWKRMGQDGIQLLYLGIGIILAAAGLFLLIRHA
jgi:hypothetical protein